MMERRKNLNDKFGFVDLMKIKDFIDYEQPNEYIVESDRYSNGCSTPVLTAGQSFILGYTNESKGIYKKGPCIIFDDFTTSVHYVDFPFKVKSSAMKILTTKSNADLKYCYYLLLSLSKMPPNHKRQWISTTSEKNHVLPSMNRQISIVKQLDLISDTIANYTNQIENLDNLVKARFIEIFGDVRENSNEFEIVQFNDIVEYMGDIGSNGANKVVVNHLDMKDEEDYAIMVRFTNFTKNDFKNDVKYVSKDAYDFFKKSQIFGGELIVCKIGSAGQNYVMPYLNRPVSLGLNQIMIRIKDTILMPYLYQYLHTDYGEFLISGCINGAVTKTITKTELKKIPILLPPMEFQHRFAEFVGHVDKSRFDIKKSIIELEREVVYD